MHSKTAVKLLPPIFIYAENIHKQLLKNIMKNEKKRSLLCFIQYFQNGVLIIFLKDLMHPMSYRTYSRCKWNGLIIYLMSQFYLKMNFRSKRNRFMTERPAGNFICRNVTHGTVWQHLCSMAGTLPSTRMMPHESLGEARSFALLSYWIARFQHSAASQRLLEAGTRQCGAPLKIGSGELCIRRSWHGFISVAAVTGGCDSSVRDSQEAGHGDVCVRRSCGGFRRIRVQGGHFKHVQVLDSRG